MKATTRLLLILALLVSAGYSLFTTMRLRRLEARLSSVEVAQRTTKPVTYAFDDSFMRYFGQPGVDAVNSAVSLGITDPDQIAREVTRHLQPK